MKILGIHWRIIVLGIIGWTLYGVFFACQAYISSAYFGRTAGFQRTLASWLLCASIWMLMTPLIYQLAQRFPLEKGKLQVSIPAHLFAALFISLTILGIYTLTWGLLNGLLLSQSAWQGFQNLLVAELHVNF